MSKFTQTFALVSIVSLLGAGCDFAPAYVPGDVPTEAQLERMSAEEKEAGMRAMLEREPAPEYESSEMTAAMMEMIEVVKNGTPERFADFEATLFHQASGSARIVKEGERLTVVFSEDFSVTPGPRLVVRVSGRGIAPLASTKGAQTYELPEDFELSAINEVDVYCQPFHVVFASASFGH
jgi:hypothetical protein